MQLPGPGGIKQRQPRIRSALLPPPPPSREPWALPRLRPNHLFLVLLIVFCVGSHALIHYMSPQLAAAAVAGREAWSRRRVPSAAASPARPPHAAAAPPSAAPPAAHATGAAAAAAASAAASAALAADDTPPLSVLIVHEHHLKAIGSDLRLLGVLLQLRSLGHGVSLLFRGAVPPAQRSPPTAELAALIGSNQTDAEPLSYTVAPRPPPAIYAHTDLGALAALARLGHFDAVLCSLWFWRDPAPSTAELVLPTLALHAPPSRRPFIGVLSDDAHSSKAAMMAGWAASSEEADAKALWDGKATSLPPRQRAVYALADAVVHISAADSALEYAQFNATCAAWKVLRMSPRAFVGAKAEVVSPPAPPAAPPATAAKRGVRLGFIGNGVTPTNHLAIQWFLQQVWPKLREQLPGVRLRLVGFEPDVRPKKSQKMACDAARAELRCGWAWGTEYAGMEEEHGIDALGFTEEAEMLRDLLSWDAMVVPILRSTGVNTKLLPALQWGVPIVLTSVAASPLQIDDSVALLADDADAFASALVRIGTTPDLRARFAAAASAHWARLLREDASAPELRALMRLVRPAIAAPPAARPLPAPVAARAGGGRPLLLPAPVASDLFSDLKGARRQNRTHGTGCFAEGARPPAILYLMHGASLPDAAALFMHTLWGSLCAVCGLKCAHGRRPAARTGWDVLIDHEASVRPEALAAAVNHAAKHIAPRELRMVHSPSAQLSAALHYAERGATLASVASGELLRAQLPAALAAEGVPLGRHASLLIEPMVNGTRASFLSRWRNALRMLKMSPLAEERLASVAEELHLRWSAMDMTPQYRGCHKDTADRDLADGPASFGHSSQSCAGACMGYKYFALQGGGQCFCGKAFGSSPQHAKAPDGQCGRVCVGEEGKTPPRLCGGGWRNAVYASPLGASETAGWRVGGSTLA